MARNKNIFYITLISFVSSSSWNRYSLLVHEHCEIIRWKIQVIVKKVGDLLYLTCIFKQHFELHWLYVGKHCQGDEGEQCHLKKIYVSISFLIAMRSKFSRALSAQWLVSRSQNKGLAQMFETSAVWAGWLC